MDRTSTNLAYADRIEDFRENLNFQKRIWFAIQNDQVTQSILWKNYLNKKFEYLHPDGKWEWKWVYNRGMHGFYELNNDFCTFAIIFEFQRGIFIYDEKGQQIPYDYKSNEDFISQVEEELWFSTLPHILSHCGSFNTWLILSRINTKFKTQIYRTQHFYVLNRELKSFCLTRRKNATFPELISYMRNNLGRVLNQNKALAVQIYSKSKLAIIDDRLFLRGNKVNFTPKGKLTEGGKTWIWGGTVGDTQKKFTKYLGKMIIDRIAKGNKSQILCIE